MTPETRDCGDCSLCCKLMSIPEMESPAGEWCTNCDPGKGCKIWEVRPPVCQSFLCTWAMGLTPEDMKPNKSKVVLTWTSDGKYPVAHVDPAKPNAWREGAVGMWLNEMAKELGRAYIVIGNTRKVIGWDVPPAVQAELEKLRQ